MSCAIMYQAIARTNIDLSSIWFCGIHLTNQLYCICSRYQLLNWARKLDIQNPHLTGANELPVGNNYCASIRLCLNWPLTRYAKIAGCACTGNAGNVFPRRRFHRKLLVSDPGMHHGTCGTHVPWCKSGSFTCGDIPGACAPAILRIWQEAHGCTIWVSRIYTTHKCGHRC